MMKISVITVVYNNVDTIEAAIQSVIGQDYPGLEYIVVDGQSTDGTLDILEKYKSRIDVFISEPDQGIYDAINKGIIKSSGEVIGLLHSDDLYAHRNVLSRVARAFQEHEVDSVYGDLVYVKRHNLGKVVRSWQAGDFEKDRFLKGWMPPHPTFFVKKRLFDKYGLYDASFKTAADYELLLRLLFKHEISTWYLNEVLIKMRVGGESTKSLRNRLRANKEDVLAWKKNEIRPKLYTRFLKPLSKLKQFFKKKIS